MSELGAAFTNTIVTDARRRVLGRDITTEEAAIGIANALAILIAHEPRADQRTAIVGALTRTIPVVAACFAADPHFRAKAASPDPAIFSTRSTP